MVVVRYFGVVRWRFDGGSGGSSFRLSLRLRSYLVQPEKKTSIDIDGAAK